MHVTDHCCPCADIIGSSHLLRTYFSVASPPSHAQFSFNFTSTTRCLLICASPPYASVGYPQLPITPICLSALEVEEGSAKTALVVASAPQAALEPTQAEVGLSLVIFKRCIVFKPSFPVHSFLQCCTSGLVSATHCLSSQHPGAPDLDPRMHETTRARPSPPSNGPESLRCATLRFPKRTNSTFSDAATRHRVAKDPLENQSL